VQAGKDVVYLRDRWNAHGGHYSAAYVEMACGESVNLIHASSIVKTIFVVPKGG